MMGQAAVDLGWRASQFWSATAHEYWAAIEVIQLRQPKTS